MASQHEVTESVADLNARVQAIVARPIFAETTLVLPEDLSEKVEPRTGAFLPFHGDTVAYFLDDATRAVVEALTDVLYARHAESLSARLPLEMAHLTLHDLHADRSQDRVRRLMDESAPRLPALVAQARDVGPVQLTCA